MDPEDRNRRTALAAEALADMLKIFGALGIVNLFSLALLYEQTVQMDASSGETWSGRIFQQVRPLDFWDWDALICGITLLFVFVRFFYGSIILIKGDYVRLKPPDHIESVDLVSVTSLIFLFPVMSFYAGAGRVEWFIWVLGVAILVDAILMWSSVGSDNSRSLFQKERQSWMRINGFTVLAILVATIALLFARQEGEFPVDRWMPAAPYAIIALYCATSLLDFFVNRHFYLGRTPPAKDR